MKRIITAIIASILVVMTAATLSGCKNENAPLTGTKVYKFAASGDSSTNVPYKVSFKVGDAKKKISEIWVNIDKMKLETTFKANAVTSSSWTAKSTSYKTFTSRPITKEEVSKAKDDYGWIALGFDSKWQNVSATQYVSVEIVGECSVNEIVFVDTDGKRMTVEINIVDYWSLSDKKEPRNVIVYDKESDEKSSPKFLIDEQEKFEKRPKKG